MDGDILESLLQFTCCISRNMCIQSMSPFFSPLFFLSLSLLPLSVPFLFAFDVLNNKLFYSLLACVQLIPETLEGQTFASSVAVSKLGGTWMNLLGAKFGRLFEMRF